jgi:hypothetical protein
MIETKTFLEVIQTLGIVIAAFYYIMTIHNTNRNQMISIETQKIALETRQASLFMELYKICTNSEFMTHQWENYDDFLKNYAPEVNPEVYNSIFSVMSFFEGVGVYLEQNLISIELVYRLLHPLPCWIWDKMSPVITERRERSDTPEIYEWFEYLVHESLKYEREVKLEESRNRSLHAWTTR